jgi:protein phosphatase 1B
VRQGFLDLDDKIRQLPEFNRGEDKSGSTAVACLITPSHTYLINCGDSRAILVSGGECVLGTYDHKPINPCERERIENAGGSVMIQRVNGSLAVSRALGDFEYKNVEGRGPCEQLVSPEPECYVRQRSERDEFIVLACDGIWDVMSNNDLKEYVHSRLKVTNDLVKISNDVLDMCLNKVTFSFVLPFLFKIKIELTGIQILS